MKILIKNGTILNGLGGAEQKGDILIENEIIKKIETEKPLKEKADKIN
jgi:dihydroorotase-like cyclic amidohydrolase